MLIRSRLESKSQQRKKLSINSSQSNSPKLNLKISTNIQQKHRSSLFRPLPKKPSEQNYPKDRQDDGSLPSIQKENLSVKKPIYHHKSEEKRQEIHILRPSLKHIRNQNSFIVLPIIDSKILKDEHPRLSMGNKRNAPNNRLVLSHVVTTQSNKGQNFTKIVEEDQPQENLPRKISNVRRSPKIKKSNTVYIQSVQDQLLDCTNTINSQSIHQESLFQSLNVTQKRAKKLSYDFLNISLSISPLPKPNMRNVQVQAIQEEREYFDYLRYKRRKQQFQTELENLFTEISLIKNDRAIYATRVQYLKSFQFQQPKNQRQQRVFKIKDQIAHQQQKFKKIIHEKLSALQKYISQVQKLNQIILVDSQKFLKTFQNLKVSKDDKKQVIFESLQNSYAQIESFLKIFLRQSIKKISMLLGRHKPEKQDIYELVSAFDEYKTTILQQKNLLKNCFGHIKKIPQMCYGLYGNKLPTMDLKNQLRNENNEFVMPKCMDCFNYEWKLHLIIEKNISMESIYKVTQQLLK